MLPRASLTYAAGLLASLIISGCSGAVSNQTPTPPPTVALPTPRPTLTPRPTPTLAAATPPAPSQPAATPTPVIYIVQAGDTLIPIANRFGVSVADLIAANGNLDATRLQIGQRLIIPQLRQSAPSDGSLIPSPTPVPYEIRGLNSVRSPAGSLDVIGEVFNPGPTGMGNVKVLVTLQDDAGNALQSAVASVPLSAVPVNQTSPFRVLFTDPPQGFTKFVVTPLRAEAVDPRAFIVPLAVRNVIGRPDGPQFRVNGEIANATAETARQARLLVTIYDAERRVVGYRYFTLSEAPLGPNEALPFDVLLTTATPNVASFAVYAEGVR
ncbi:MAG: LysM peptidoglycan-binding domain-containing protein [Thermoflexales bacterium]